MIIVRNNSGLGNRIKNVVSALRKGHIRGDVVTVQFPHEHLFQYAQCMNVPLPGEDIYNTWILELWEEDQGRAVLKEDQEFVIIHDENNTFRVNNRLDFQYHNILPEWRKEFLRYFELLLFNPAVLSQVDQFCQQTGIEQAIGVHIRSWVDEPTRRRVLFDIDQVQQAMQSTPNRHFFVCSDDQSVVDALTQAFPGRVYSRNQSEVRHVTYNNDPAVAVDSLIDMLVLSRCHSLIGTYESTFSECAWWLGGCRQSVLIPVPKMLSKDGSRFWTYTEQRG